MSASRLAGVKALGFDVFGTVVDWRASIIREGQALGRAKGLDVDWEAFTDAWRGLYQPALEKVRSGAMPWTRLDDLHRMSLDRLLEDFKIEGLSAAEVDDLNHVWHRLDPWPDSVPGLTRLTQEVRPRHALQREHRAHGQHGQAGGTSLGRGARGRAGARLQAAARGLSHAPPTSSAGFPRSACWWPRTTRTSPPPRGWDSAPPSCGGPPSTAPRQTRDLRADQSWDAVAESMIDLADKLGC